ncbi:MULTISPECIES: hypothetical protein [unclassified Pseudomonas]|uniref:hypothetical protein n=1 Tax=unclassified Pseudomonas TaxID=196821 RepID=UPI00103295E1|nr:MULTISPECIES: hypothetical protein [unclassified Pseudomonas]
MNDQSQEPYNLQISQILTITLDQLLSYLNNNDCMHPCAACGKSNWSIPLADNMPAIYMTPSVRNPSISAWAFHVNCNECGGIKIFNAARVREYVFANQGGEDITHTAMPIDHPLAEVQSLEIRTIQLEDHTKNIQEDIESLEGELQTFRTETKGELSSLRDEFSSVRAEIQQEFTCTRQDMKKESRVRFWVLMLITGGLASLMIRGFGWV